MSERDEALEEAARMIDSAVLKDPLGEVEEHVNQVLQDLAVFVRKLKRD